MSEVVNNRREQFTDQSHQLDALESLENDIQDFFVQFQQDNTMDLPAILLAVQNKKTVASQGQAQLQQQMNAQVVQLNTIYIKITQVKSEIDELEAEIALLERKDQSPSSPKSESKKEVKDDHEIRSKKLEPLKESAASQDLKRMQKERDEIVQLEEKVKNLQTEINRLEANIKTQRKARSEKEHSEEQNKVISLKQRLIHAELDLRSLKFEHAELSERAPKDYDKPTLQADRQYSEEKK